MSEQLIGFGGYQDDNDENLKGKSGGFTKFGLNQGALLTQLIFNPLAGAKETPGEAIDINISVGEKKYMMRLFPITKVFHKNNEIDKSHPEYVKEYNAAWSQLRGIMTHIMKAYVSEATLKTALNSPTIVDFKTWAEAHVALLPAGYQNKPVDVFLQYQWQIKDDNDKTYLELPKNMKGGYWFCAAQPGTFVEDRTNGLKYINEKNIEHPFTRDQSFMESAKAIQQVEGNSSGSAIETPVTQGAAPAASKW